MWKIVIIIDNEKIAKDTVWNEILYNQYIIGKYIFLIIFLFNNK